MTSEPRVPASGRPRNPALDDAILRATQDQLIEHGFDGMTVDAVARAAGSGKAAVYRRWPSKTALVVASVRALYAPPTVPDTGSLRGDLVACALHYGQADGRAALVLASVLAELPRAPELRTAAFDAIGRPPALAMRTVMERWQQRGAIAPDAPIDLLVGIIPALAFRTVAFRRRPLDTPTIVETVDRVLLPALGAPSVAPT
ncbi:TetR/AcrR family transcriptional regulator [Propionicimonas sp.]|uniref:TetR/AcrR family transcriptional regulator n=1 Tax=Propionicimonas sp. TaxID=1955623 RepID=UPI0039E3B8D6